MFNTHNLARVALWRQLRNTLETAIDPLDKVVKLWATAPFVPLYLNPFYSKSWPDPWKLVIDSKFDSLAIVLGMLYTLQLTDRFSDESYEIYMSGSLKDPEFYLKVGSTHVLNLVHREVSSLAELEKKSIIMIYCSTNSNKYPTK